MNPRTTALTVTPAGLRIGLAHIPRPLPIEADAARVQLALLEPRTARPLPVLARIAGAIWRWL